MLNLLMALLEDLNLSLAGEPAVQLAHTWDRKWIPKNAILEPKIDGVRGLIFIRGGEYKAISRLGNDYHNVGHIAKELLDKADGYVIDGEFVASDWSSTISAVKTAERGDTSVRFVAFDILPIDEFLSKQSSKPLSERRRLLRQIVGKTKNIRVTREYQVSTSEDVDKKVEEFYREGFEGGMLKDLDSSYDFKRSRAWVKIKKFTSEDFPVVGFIEGKGKYAGTLGVLLVKGPNGKVSGVGTGFTDKDRNDIWNNKDDLLGKLVEVKYQDITDDGALKMPVFHRFRVDIDEAEASRRTTRKEAKKIFDSLSKLFEGVANLLPAGSLRRGSPNMKDIDIVPVISDMARFEQIRKHLFEGKKRGLFRGVRIEFYPTGPNPLFSQWIWTGDKKYRISLHARAKAKGYKLNAYGLWKDTRLISTDIDEVANLLHTPVLSPEKMVTKSPSLPD